MTAFKDWKESLVEGKNPCIKCREKGNDNSGDNFHFYGEGRGGFCHACQYTIPSDDYLDEEHEQEEEKLEIDIMTKEFSLKDWNKYKEKLTTDPKGYRGLTQETCAFFSVQHEYSTETGELLKQLYPNTKNYEFSGIKGRGIPKDFFAKGIIDNDCELFGQWRFKNSTSKFVVICAGEIDQLSGYQMLNHKKTEYEPIPVVSPTNGETGSHKQLQKQYEWLDTFEKIVLCYDNDEAGQKAIEKAVKVLPLGKVYVMKLTLKDTNEYLVRGRDKEWVNAFWRAEKYTPRGITSSLNLEDKMKEYVSIPRLSLPPFMYKMQNMLCGGFPMGYIVNILAASGIGKSTLVDAMILHWIMNDDRLVGIVSLEASEGEYGVNLSSAYQKSKINLLESEEERLQFLEETVDQRKNLWAREDGSPRFYLVDADVDNMKSKIEYLIRSIGCKIIVLDPLQDVFDELGDDQQAKWMKWQKDIVKREQVIMININHSRKSGRGEKANSKGADLSEEDMMGHSSIFKSGGINIVVSRDKENEDPFERNVTRSKITKARGVGRTGYSGDFYYENDTHTLYDKDWYLENKMKPEEV